MDFLYIHYNYERSTDDPFLATTGSVTIQNYASDDQGHL